MSTHNICFYGEEKYVLVEKFLIWSCDIPSFNFHPFFMLSIQIGRTSTITLDPDQMLQNGVSDHCLDCLTLIKQFSDAPTSSKMELSKV